jgi:sugar-specific transcriptional regulator TrmB
MDTQILEDLGLTNSEIKTYMALLELGSSTAGTILEKSKIQNSVLHRALNSLIEKGVITYILEGKNKVYQANDPENFIQFIEDKKKRFEQVLPELRNIQLFAKQKTKAEIFKNKKGINELYTNLLKSGGKEYNTFGGGSQVTYDVMGETWWKNLHAKRIDKKIPSRQIFDNTIRKFGKELNKKPLTKIKFLPKDYVQLQETVIIGDQVGIIIFTENPYGILIQDQIVADGYRKQFEILWKNAKD